MPTRPTLDSYREVWLVASESSAPPGERTDPVCLVGREFRSGRTVQCWRDEIRQRSEAPYPTDGGALLVAFGASDVLACHLESGWPLPSLVLDLHAEHRNQSNGLTTPHGTGLYGTLAWYGLDPFSAVEGPRVRALVAPGGRCTVSERQRLLDSVESRVTALSGSLAEMLPEIDLGRALLRGRYGSAVARMERFGVPIDVPTLRRLRAGWRAITDALIRDIDERFGVYDGPTFRPDRWEAFLDREAIPWPRVESGALALDDDTFREMARSHPAVALMRELRTSLSQLRLDGLTVGSDGRNRVPLAPFASKTGRNQPSSSRFIFGPSCWLRGLIRPEPGRALAYVDWTQHEYGIAAGRFPKTQRW